MRWILSARKDLVVDIHQLKARSNYIRRVTNSKVSDWVFMQVDGETTREFLCCASSDDLDGTFITAHVYDINKLCALRQVCMGKFVVANTCIWEMGFHKKLLSSLRRVNPESELWFAKQELSIDDSHIFRQSVTICDVSKFGFQTSLSERQLFTNKDLGIWGAIRKSFNRVSPIILLGE